MTAKELAEKLLEHPEATVEVEFTYSDSERFDIDYTERRGEIHPYFHNQSNELVMDVTGKNLL